MAINHQKEEFLEVKAAPVSGAEGFTLALVVLVSSLHVRRLLLLFRGLPPPLHPPPPVSPLEPPRAALSLGGTARLSQLDAYPGCAQLLS